MKTSRALIVGAGLCFASHVAGAETVPASSGATAWGYSFDPYVSFMTKWLKTPSQPDYQAAYPKNAHGVGSVNLTCSVLADGSLGYCRVQAEAPTNKGFGTAALSLMPLFRVAPFQATSRPGALPQVSLTIRLQRLGEPTDIPLENCLPPMCIREQWSLPRPSSTSPPMK